MLSVRLLTRRKWHWALLIALISIAGAGAGFTLPAAAPASQEIRKATTPEAFKSGGERSVPVLREIAGTLESGNQRSEKVLREIVRTLERIDTRLQRIEQAVVGAANKERTLHPASPNRR